MPLQMAHLQRDDWIGNFQPAVFERGRLYAKQGMARLIRVGPDAIEGRCLGSTDRPYRQHIRLRADADRWQVLGRCSCQAADNCKHVVAVLLTVERLQQQGDPMAMPVASPAPAPERLIDDLTPEPLLQLGSHSRVHYDARKGRMLEQTQHRAALSFVYAGHRTFGQGPGDLRVRGENGESLRIRRDPDAEAALRQTLAGLGLKPALRRSEALPEDAGEPLEMADEGAWLAFVQQRLPELRNAGWTVRIDPAFRYRLETIDDWYVRIEEAPGQQWFDLEMGIEVDGRRISLLPVLLAALRQTPWLLSPRALAERPDEALLATLPRVQGEPERRVALPLARLKPLLETLGELYLLPDEPMEALRLNRADAARLARLEPNPTLTWHGGEALRRFATRLQQLPHRELVPPAGLNASLRSYQRDGVAWLQGLAELRLGGILADDMGLGKTLQTLAHILLEKQAGRLRQPALIVMPTSLISNWQDEAARFAPGLRVVALHGPKRRALFAEMDQADLLLTTYALLCRDARELNRLHYHLLVLDEAQTIKNPRSRAANAARAIQANQRLCLTGTPLENHLGELWSLFHFLMPGWLGEQKSFTRDYRLPIEKHADAARLEQLLSRLRPFMLRRSKEQVAAELPARTVITRWVELTDTQRDHYETLRLALDGKVREEIARQGLAGSRIVVLEALLRLRQVCCDLRLLDDQQAWLASHSAKMVAVLDMLESLVAEGRRVLLFSQFTRLLGLIELELQKRAIPYALLTGSTRDRATPVRDFQAGKLPVFLISLKAGGAGLNLTAADTVIHFDPWWNPAVEAQASDRAHRIGQDKPVFIYRLIARGSIEEKIQQLQQHKASLARGVLDAGGLSEGRLNSEDLEQLLAPLD